MPVIDADGHVQESEATWSFLDSRYHERRPLPVSLGVLDTYHGPWNSVWIIDGELNPKMGGRGPFINASPVTAARATAKPYSAGAQTMEDMPARLADLDKYNIDYQVVMPSVFLYSLTDDPDFNRALARSYNRFMARACEKSKGRVFFAGVIPVLDVKHAVQEAREARQTGAVAAFVAGGMAGSKSMGSSQFDLLYDELCKLDIPLVLHFGSWSPPQRIIYEDIIDTRFNALTLPAVMGIHSMITHGVFERFPQLRVAVLEVGSMWVPYVMHQVSRHYDAGLFRDMKRSPSEYARAGNLWVSCEADEDIRYVGQWIGEDHLVMASDYPHWDASREENMAQALVKTKLSAETTEKILYSNPKTLYNLPI